ncbi:MAG: hypothetical protein JWO48_3349 [Bryobacterales bacterium]|nr:hypothetical protein [Bryobacterales bacterium]
MAERDFTAVQNKLARAAQAVRDARESVNTAIREIGDDAMLRDIDQFSTREACTVLAALRLFQVIQCDGGELPFGNLSFLGQSSSSAVTRLTDLEHFETETPLSVTELDDLCERIEVDFNR